MDVVKLLVLDGERVDREIVIDRPVYVIGRSAACQLQIDHSLVSLQHCQVRNDGVRVWVEDLESTYGTILNTRKVDKSELHDGDRLRVGPTVFQVAIEAGRPVSSSVRAAAGARVVPAAHVITPTTDRGRDPNQDTAAVAAARQIFERLTSRKEREQPTPAPEAAPAAEDPLHTASRSRKKSRLQVEESEGVAVVNILDRAIIHDNEIHQIGEELDHLISRGHNRILLDFGNVRHMSSQAVGVLLRAQRRCKSTGGLLKVCKPNPEVAEIFKITNLPRAIEVHPDEEQALRGEWPEGAAAPRPQDRATPAPGGRTAPPKAHSSGITRPAAHPGQVRLVIDVGKSKGKTIPINSPKYLIGRDPQCQLRPASEAVSRTHTLIELRDGRVFVRDLGSANGTLVNDRALHLEEVEVHNGDRLQIGPLQFTMSIATPAPDTEEDAAASWLLEAGNVPMGDTALYPVTAEASKEARRKAISEIQRLRYQVVGDVLVVTLLATELRDEEQIGPVRHELLVLLEQPLPRRLVLRMDRVTFLSSAAIGMLLGHFQRLDRLGGGMRFCMVRDEVLPALERLNTGSMVEIYPTVEAAVREEWPVT